MRLRRVRTEEVRINMARTKIPVDEKLLEKLTKLHLSDRTIADCLGISEDTLHRRYAEPMAHWRSTSDWKIADALFDEAINKRQPWALKMIAQRRLGYADRIQAETDNKHNVAGDLSIEIQDRIERIKSEK